VDGSKLLVDWSLSNGPIPTEQDRILPAKVSSFDNGAVK